MIKEENRKIRLIEMIETKVKVPWVTDKTGKEKSYPVNVNGPELKLHFSLLEKKLMLSVPGDPDSEKVPYEA